MSRVERKKLEKRSKRYFRLLLAFQIAVLVCGLLVVDYSIREMLGIDENSLLGYRVYSENQYTVHIMGWDYLLDLSSLKAGINNKFAEFEEMNYNIKKWIQSKWEKVLQ